VRTSDNGQSARGGKFLARAQEIRDQSGWKIHLFLRIEEEYSDPQFFLRIGQPRRGQRGVRAIPTGDGQWQISVYKTIGTPSSTVYHSDDHLEQSCDGLLEPLMIEAGAALGAGDEEASLQGREAIALTGRVVGPGTFAAMPDGEAAIAPVEGTAEGTVVVEHTMDNLGLLDAPIRMEVRAGRVIGIPGGASAASLQALLASADENALNIAEFAIGTNDQARLIGSMTEDKKYRGSVHVGLGNNHVIGGTVVSSLHLDGLVLNPTVELDGRVIVENGRLLIG